MLLRVDRLAGWQPDLRGLPVQVKDLSSLKCEATLLQSVDIFAEEHGLPHFLMDAPDDLLTLTDAFHQVVSGGLKNVVAKAEELR
jgi:hypothetical protein